MMPGLSSFLIKSFAENRGTRGVHFYDDVQCEFMPWDKVMSSVKERFPENFYDKLIDAVANYDPDNEFVTVTAGDSQLTIELFKSQDM